MLQMYPVFVGLDIQQDSASKINLLSPPNNRAAARMLRKPGLEEAAERVKHLGIKEAVDGTVLRET